MPTLYTAAGGYTYYAEDNSTDRPLYEHRLVAYAHGLIDDLDDPRQVHHLDGCPFLNSPENLLPIGHEEHYAHHLHGEAV